MFKENVRYENTVKKTLRKLYKKTVALPVIMVYNKHEF